MQLFVSAVVVSLAWGFFVRLYVSEGSHLKSLYSLRESCFSRIFASGLRWTERCLLCSVPRVTIDFGCLSAYALGRGRTTSLLIQDFLTQHASRRL